MYMTKGNSEKLTDRFEFMRSSGNPMVDSLVFGFEVSDGWFKLLWDLCIDLEKLDVDYQKTIPDDAKAKGILELGYDIYTFKVTQVKEKFGTLRFYTNGCSEEMYARIREAENQSAEICEICGELGTISRRHGWTSTMCEKCIEVDKKHGTLNVE